MGAKPPLELEVGGCIQSLKNEKTVGPNGLLSVIFKLCKKLFRNFIFSPPKIGRNDSKGGGQDGNKPNKPGRGGGQRGPIRDGQARFVQSYSIFETGIGCAVKTEKHAVELCEAQPSGAKRNDIAEIHETEEKHDPMEHSDAFITDIKQQFKDAPTIMQDSAAGVQQTVDPLRDLDLSEGRNHRVPYEFFRDSEMGRLFTIQLPDQLLPSDFDQIKEGTFGKIQLLDNHQVRLVVGGVTFDLVSPRALTHSSDVILVNDRGDDLVRLNCLGHLDQSMVAVPNLEEFVRIGQ
ncbi:unnamed protein product [Echinostoma caproni]|uniref:Uncharacterized protein n=1 Tax=Echinostoma caproni TaxID=27848 RepID=A0A183AH30_9TREM|nr:unnamed protein product [Echinostoma caproni]